MPRQAGAAAQRSTRCAPGHLYAPHAHLRPTPPAALPAPLATIASLYVGGPVPVRAPMRDAPTHALCVPPTWCRVLAGGGVSCPGGGGGGALSRAAPLTEPGGDTLVSRQTGAGCPDQSELINQHGLQAAWPAGEPAQTGQSWRRSPAA